MSHILTTVKVTHHNTTEIKALIDSAAGADLMNWGLAEHLGLKTEPLAQSIEAKALNGERLFSITHVTEPVQLCINDHEEQLSFYLITSPAHTLILGLPWLIRHDPHVNWGDLGVEGELCRGVH